MKIKHYSSHHLHQVRRRLKFIIELSHRNRVGSTEALSCELLADDIPHARKNYLDRARSIRKKIEERKAEIEAHKNWIGQQCPRFFKKVSFVQKHVTTWDLELAAVRFPPSQAKPLERKKSTLLTLGERRYNLEKRITIMNKWYCFFFGDSHLNSHHSLHQDE